MADVGIIEEQQAREAPERRPPRRPAVPRALVVLSEWSWRGIVIALAVGLVVWAVSQVPLVAVPILVALLASTLLVPPTRWLCEKGLPRWAATPLVFFGALLVLGGVIALIAPPVIEEVDELGQQINLGVEEVADFLSEAPFGLSQDEAVRQINELTETIRQNIEDITSRVVSGALLAVELVAGLIITLFLLFFFIKDGPRMWDWVVGLFPRRRRETMAEVGHDVWSILGRYVRGLVFVATIDAVFIGIGLAIIGIPLVLPLAVLTFMLAFIPFVGAVVAGAAAALVGLVSEGLGTALAVVGVVTLVQQLEGNLLYPLIVGKSLELHPAVILVVVTTGALLFGIAGAFLAVPVTAGAAAAIAVVNRRTDADSAPDVVVTDRVPPP